MKRHIEQEVLAGFREEVRGYLPEIVKGLETARAEPGRLDALEVIFPLAHGIKGAAAIVGLPALSHVAYYTEEAVEQIVNGEAEWNPAAARALETAVARIREYIELSSFETELERVMLGEVVAAFRRWRGQPEDGDKAEIDSLVAQSLPAETELIADALPDVDEPEQAWPPEDDTAPPPPAPAGAIERMEDIPPELLEAFQPEAEEHLHVISTRLRELEQNPEHREVLLDVRRSVHTLKGASGMVGLRSVSRLSHRMEDLLDRLSEGAVPFSDDIIRLLLGTSDALEDLLGERAKADELHKLYSSYDELLRELPDEPAAPAPAPALAPLGQEKPIQIPETAAREAAVQPALPAPQRKQGQFVRVPLERIEELVRLVSELVVNRSTFEGHLAAYHQEVDELYMAVDRVKRIAGRLDTDYATTALQAVGLESGGGPSLPVSRPWPSPGRRGEFDVLEFDRYTEFHLLTRDLSESSNDLSTANNRLSDLGGDLEGYLNRLQRLTSEVQDKLMRLRMVPLATLVTRLHRTVRVTSGLRDKSVELVVEGEHVELDKTVIEEMAGPLEHILRNSVDHGIEPPAVRCSAGKPERGQIRLRAYYEGTQVVIQVRDDGAGFDMEKLRGALVRQGYASPDEAGRMSDQDVLSHAFQPGFSTAEQVSEVSGRGIGLDVLKNTVNRLKGTIAVESKSGQGSTFTIRLPMTLAVARVLLVRVHQETYAVPLRSVTQILRIERDQVEKLGNQDVLRVEGQVVPAIHLGEALGLSGKGVDPQSLGRRIPVLVLNLGERRLALMVDQLIEAREVVVKSLGSVLQRVRGVSGATLMGDGSVVMIVNPSDLGQEEHTLHAPRRTGPEQASQLRRPLEIMVVDDSLSVRRVLSTLVTNAGWNVTAAKDGVEALEILARSNRKPDCILLDIEMPRMDGYEMTTALRSQEAYKKVPIVMLTSRSGAKHRQKAFSLGATDYLIKPYHDDTLLSVVRRVVRESREAAPE